MEPKVSRSPFLSLRPTISSLADSIYDKIRADGEPWTVDQGMALCSLLAAAESLGDARYLDFVKNHVDCLVARAKDGRSFEDTFTLESLTIGTVLISLWRRFHGDAYANVILWLRERLRSHPRTSAVGFWYKKTYPHQIRLEGLNMFGPFCAAYARHMNEPELFDELCAQLIVAEARTRDVSTGLLHHALDASRKQLWAHPHTGCSPHFWGRGMGLFGMAVVDVLDHLPPEHVEYSSVVAILRRFADAMARVQDNKSGLWYQVLDQPRRKKNFTETSVSAMSVYVFAKGVRMGYLDRRYLETAKAGYTGLITHRLVTDDSGYHHVSGICKGVELGGNPYRDGSYDCYVNNDISTDDIQGVAPLLMACIEIERMAR